LHPKYLEIAMNLEASLIGDGGGGGGGSSLNMVSFLDNPIRRAYKIKGKEGIGLVYYM
jgi:hypothetical protein